MGKKLLALGILLVGLSSTTVVKAGTINEYEEDVIAAAKDQYVYMGKEYKIDPAYINELTSFLLEDDVDLDKEQRDEILGSINNYIEKGVNNGYLIPLEEERDSESTSDTDSHENTTDPFPDSTSKEESKAPTEASTPNNPGQDSMNAQSGSNTDTEVDSKEEDFISGIVSEALRDDSNASKENAEEDYKPTSIKENIIKETGFNFNRTIMIATGIGVIMILGIIASIKFNLFAHKDEH